MSGYGYSVWLVPLSYRVFQRGWCIRHIPHVTLSTNHVEIPSLTNRGQCYDVKNFGPLTMIPSQYKSDSLNACGWFCDIVGYEMKLDHLPHMTFMYSKTPFTVLPMVNEEPLHDTIAQILIADTRSIDPLDWYIMN